MIQIKSFSIESRDAKKNAKMKKQENCPRWKKKELFAERNEMLGFEWKSNRWIVCQLWEWWWWEAHNMLLCCNTPTHCENILNCYFDLNVHRKLAFIWKPNSFGSHKSRESLLIFPDFLYSECLAWVTRRKRLENIFRKKSRGKRKQTRTRREEIRATELKEDKKSSPSRDYICIS